MIVYYFYELGVPIINTTPRLQAQDTLQQVTAVERGYNLYEANCARCHGANGEGGIGPVLNDQMKLFSHLNAQYLKNVLTVGGRYVCGNAKSVMPVWADTNGGPLNYIQIEDLIAFIRAPSTQEYTRRNPEFNEPIIGADGKVLTFKGWRDTTFKPDPSRDPGAGLLPGRPAAPAPPPSVDPDPAGRDDHGLERQLGYRYARARRRRPARRSRIHFDNQDAGADARRRDIRHDGTVVDVVTTRSSPARRDDLHDLPALAAGTYTFICSVHPIPAMTGTLTVK